jgi:hypothetical protein
MGGEMCPLSDQAPSTADDLVDLCRVDAKSIEAAIVGR